MRGWEIGRIGGVPLEVPPNFLLWTVFLWWSLQYGFPRSHIGFPENTYRLLAIGATFLVVGAILLHEIVTLRAQKMTGGVLPRRVILGPLGGWHRTDSASTEPAAIRAEILASFCGPAAYMAMAIGCMGTGLSLQPLLPDFLPTRAVIDTVAIACSSLAFLNLLPGAPLDGGRILAAAVRRVKGDADRGIAAARTGGLMIGAWLCALGVMALWLMGTMWAFWGIILGVAILDGVGIVAPSSPELRDEIA